MTMALSAAVPSAEAVWACAGTSVCASQLLEADNRAPRGSVEAGSPQMCSKQGDLHALSLKWGNGTHTEATMF